MTDLIHWETVRTFTARTGERVGVVKAWCYGYYDQPRLTTDPFAVTCGKCQASKVVKAAAVASF